MANQNPLPLSIGIKMWFKAPSAPRSLFGPGDIRLIKSLLKTKNLTHSAKELEYSYKYAWQKLHDLADKTGKDIVKTHRGGEGGGGEVRVTAWGEYLVQVYEEVNSRLQAFQREINHYLKEKEFGET
jgi:molybdate transport system regulatory protein